jgi:hypothetical protein
MVVTGIFRLEEVDLADPSAAPASGEIFEEKIAETETLVAVRARSLHQAKLLSDLLSQAGARNVEIDAEAA